MPLSDFLTAYRGREAAMQAEPMRELQQAGVLQGVLAKQQAMQQERELRGVLSQSGGDPSKAIKILLQSGSPKAIELAAKLKGLLPKPPEDRVVASGGALVDPTGKVKYQAPFKPDKPEASPEFIKLQNAAQQYPEGHPLRVQIEARLKMLQERQPGVTVNMPASSDTVRGEDGRYYKFRVGKDGKAEAIPIADAQGNPLRPPESPAAEKVGEEKAAEEVTLKNVRGRIEKMATLIQGGGLAGGVVGPLGMASRIGETAVGMAQPSAPTPALDYQNEMRLLLSDVRKMVEKDPNLSKDEREAMYETLGGGFMQTPGSALRTLNNIINHVESKQRSRPTRTARPPAPPPEKRSKDAIYQTPKGPMRWTGTGWLPAN